MSPPTPVATRTTTVPEAVIVSALRTPVGSFGGAFKDIPATELAAQAIRAALEHSGLAGEDDADPQQVHQHAVHGRAFGQRLREIGTQRLDDPDGGDGR